MAQSPVRRCQVPSAVAAGSVLSKAQDAHTNSFNIHDSMICFDLVRSAEFSEPDPQAEAEAKSGPGSMPGTVLSAQGLVLTCEYVPLTKYSCKLGMHDAATSMA